MNWDAFGAVAEMIGAAAVLLTLIYLQDWWRQNRGLFRPDFVATVESVIAQRSHPE